MIQLGICYGHPNITKLSILPVLILKTDVNDGQIPGIQPLNEIEIVLLRYPKNYPYAIRISSYFYIIM